MHLCVNSLTVETKYHIKATEDASSVLFEYSIAFKKTPMKSFFLSSSFSENVTIYCCKALYPVNEYSVLFKSLFSKLDERGLCFDFWGRNILEYSLAFN